MKLMKAIVCMSIVMLCVSEAVAGSFTDSRDGKTYKTVKMPDGETWMAENLNYNMNGSMCYGNDASNCSKYGRLYTWEAAKKACPSGWHLPSKDDLDFILASIGDDKYGFSPFPAGYYDSYNKGFDKLGSYVLFWSSSENKSNFADVLGVYDGSARVVRLVKHDGVSVRCLQD